jgi:Reverse transcriptase (RNA-dependent DNA polymerase)
MDPFSLLKIDQLLDSTSGHAFLSFMDAFSWYNQIKMCEEDEVKTTFIINLGLYCYKVISFGLRNAGATFQRMVNKMFEKQICNNMEACVDDILVKSMTKDCHLADFEEAFATMNKVNMKMNPKKSYFGLAEGKILGFMISIRGIEIHPSSSKAILDMQPPWNLKKLQSFIGRLATLNRFIAKSDKVCLPFFKAMRKAERFEWTTECA